MTEIKVLCGLLAGIILCLSCFILRYKWQLRRAVRKGRKGEKIVAKELRRIEGRDALVLNDILLPASDQRTSQIDHIVVSRRGIFVIETKSLAGRISGSEHSQYWQQHLSSQTRQIYNPLLQNQSHIRTLHRLLPEIDQDMFVSMVVFTEAWRLDLTADDIIRRRRILPDLHIRRTFIPAERRKKRWWCPGSEVRLDESRIVTPLEGMVDEIERRKRIMSRDEIKRIAGLIEEKVIHGRRAAGEHTSYARHISGKISNQIRQGNCPRCGARLVVRKGDKGEFVGCENYPECRFTCSIDRLH